MTVVTCHLHFSSMSIYLHSLAVLQVPSYNLLRFVGLLNFDPNLFLLSAGNVLWSRSSGELNKCPDWTKIIIFWFPFLLLRTGLYTFYFKRNLTIFFRRLQFFLFFLFASWSPDNTFLFIRVFARLLCFCTRGWGGGCVNRQGGLVGRGCSLWGTFTSQIIQSTSTVRHGRCLS